MEAVTAFAWGPASFVTVYAVLRRLPWRYGLMLIISVGQMYGDVLYFATCFFEGLKHTRPEQLYFWGYFLGANGIWIVVPGLVALHALRQMSKAVAGVETDGTAAHKANGTVGKRFVADVDAKAKDL